jgi:hypothetical protein
MGRRGEYGFDGNNDRRTCRGGAANENDKIAPPHGSPQDEVHTLSARGALCITAILARYVGSGSKTAV